MTTTTTNDNKKPRYYTTNLKALGFCGADDSVDPNLLGIICHSYPFVEFGVLFRPDKEGQPRFASSGWVKRLAAIAAKNPSMRLAAHLCSTRVNELLNGDGSFLSYLSEWGFRRVQINATVVNGVDTSELGEKVGAVAEIMAGYPKLEFIIQKNEETRPLWETLLQSEGPNYGDVGKLPSNVTMLLDESKGTGVLSKSYPEPPKEYNIGYAGGIGPKNIETVLEGVMEAGNGRDIWIDMESSLRSQKDGVDIFDLDKCYQCIVAVCEKNIYKHPDFLPQV